MTIFHLHEDGLGERSGGGRFAIGAAWQLFAKRLSLWTSRTKAGFGAVHRAIVAAKLRRIERELMLHSLHGSVRERWGTLGGHGGETDATKFPQRPMIIGDKWDF
jgi:hypothetical protein